MRILKRLHILGHCVTIIETEHELDIEFPPKMKSKGKEVLKSYLEEEGFIEEICAGNTHFELNEIAYVDTDDE